jgi:predicted house-cleaning noncanonical NTP pyrophosphatase (MazG superfamily)
MKPKLIRDRIPEIMREVGVEAIFETLDGEHFQSALREKLIEEATEACYASAPDNLVAEIADLYEVIDALLQYHQIPKAAVIEEQTKRREGRGGFVLQLLLKGQKGKEDK